MEILKIKGGKVAKVMEFPTWTLEELELWEEKDEAACQKWREAKSKKWEDGNVTLAAKYPTREDLDGWLDKQCLSSRNNSLWKRTRDAKKIASAVQPAQDECCNTGG